MKIIEPKNLKAFIVFVRKAHRLSLVYPKRFPAVEIKVQGEQAFVRATNGFCILAKKFDLVRNPQFGGVFWIAFTKQSGAKPNWKNISQGTKFSLNQYIVHPSDTPNWSTIGRPHAYFVVDAKAFADRLTGAALINREKVVLKLWREKTQLISHVPYVVGQKIKMPLYYSSHPYQKIALNPVMLLKIIKNESVGKERIAVHYSRTRIACGGSFLACIK